MSEDLDFTTELRLLIHTGIIYALHGAFYRDQAPTEDTSLTLNKMIQEEHLELANRKILEHVLPVIARAVHLGMMASRDYPEVDTDEAFEKIFEHLTGIKATKIPDPAQMN